MEALLTTDLSIAVLVVILVVVQAIGPFSMSSQACELVLFTQIVQQMNGLLCPCFSLLCCFYV